MAKGFIELNHVIEDGMITYEGLPGPLICDFISREASQAHYEPGTSFHIGKMELVSNTGTYLDTPFHRYEDGVDLTGVGLDSLAELPGLTVRVDHKKQLAIGPEHFKGLDLEGKAILIHTGWDQHWQREQYFLDHPYLSAAGAMYLEQEGVVLVGIDSYNLDNTQERNRPAHSLLLRQGIPIVEHLCHLEKLPDTAFTFSAVPPRIHGMGTFPVRAYARV